METLFPEQETTSSVKSFSDVGKYHFAIFLFYRFGKKPENFFNALRGCQNRVEPNAKILQQELKENPSLLLTLGKLREFFQDPYQSPKSHFNEKIRLNAIQFNRNWEILSASNVMSDSQNSIR